MPADRMMPTEEAADLIELTRDIVDKELRPRVDEAERAHVFPRDVFTTLGRAGLLSLPYPETYGGGGQPYEVYLQVLEEIASAWAAVGVGTSVHALSCFGLFHAGTQEQKQRWLPGMLGGELLGAYCLSEAHAGSDPAALGLRADPDPDIAGGYRLTGEKLWISNAPDADVYTVFARSAAATGARGLTAFAVPGDSPGLSGEPRDMLAAHAIGSLTFDDVPVGPEQVLGQPGAGFRVAQHGAVLARDAGGRPAPQAVERPARAAQLVHEGGQRRVGRIAQGRAPEPGGEHGLKAGRTLGGPADPAGGTGEGAPGDVGVPPVAGWFTALQRGPGAVPGQHVPRRVAQAHRSTVEPLEQAHRSGPDLARHLAAGRAVPSQRAEPFVVRPPQPQCAGQSGHHTGRRVTLPLFQPPHVVSRDPGQLGQLLPAQPPNPPPPAGREPDLSGPGAFPQLTQGRPKFVLLPHGPSVPDPRSWSGGRAVPDCRW